MFLVLNREKISSYIVAFSTIIVLFIMSVVLNQKDAVQTAANTLDNNTNNIETNENNSSINIGENYTEEDIERILKRLDENESKVDFYVYKSWAEKNQNLIKNISNHGYRVIELEETNN